MGDSDQWVFVSSSDTRVVSVDYVDGDMRYVTGLFSDGAWLGYSSSAPNTLYAWNYDVEDWMPFVRFGYASTPWDFELHDGCGRFTARRTGSGVTVATPAGTFKSARTISYELDAPPNVRCAAPDIAEITFAGNVGPVAFVTGWGEEFFLKSASVGGTTFPLASGKVNAVASSDKATYTNRPNTIRCVTTPCPTNDVTAKAKLKLTVKNTGTTTETFQFNSGKQFDFYLFDAAGFMVKAWSDDRAFTTALSAFNLSPGQTKVFSGEVELKDRWGYQLEGSYTVRGLVTSPSVAGLSVTDDVSIQVRLQP
jgi:hypothetical protein